MLRYGTSIICKSVLFSMWHRSCSLSLFFFILLFLKVFKILFWISLDRITLICHLSNSFLLPFWLCGSCSLMNLFISSLAPSAPEFLFFYYLYIFIKLLFSSIVYHSFVYCSPVFVQLSYCSFYSTLIYLKQLFLLLQWINHKSPIFLCEYWRFLHFVGVMILWVHVSSSFVVLFSN